MDIKTLLELKSIYEKRKEYIDIIIDEQKIMIEGAVTTYDKVDRTIGLLEYETKSKTLGFVIAITDEQIRRTISNN